MNIIKRQLSLLSLALCTVFTVVTPLSVQAQSSSTVSRGAATISSFDVQQLRRLRPGNVLSFSLIGSPGAAVSLQIAGATRGLQLSETSPGTYQGDYTIRSRDRLTGASLVTARVLKSGQTVSATLSRSLLLGEPDLVQQSVAQISTFNVTAPDGTSPGDELTFALSGTPGAKVRVAVQGIDNAITLSEVSRGSYEGAYVIRRQDRLGSELNVEGFLLNGRRETSQRFQQRLSLGRDESGRNENSRNDGSRNDGSRNGGSRNDGRDGRQQAMVTCASCGAVESVNVVEVQGDAPNVLGTIAGGLLGGVVGNQIGGGSGKDIATIVGAVGGAYAGNRVQNNMGKSKVFRVAVRLDNGGTQNFDYAEDPAVQVGTRVKIDNGVLLRL